MTETAKRRQTTSYTCLLTCKWKTVIHSHEVLEFDFVSMLSIGSDYYTHLD